MALCLGYFSMIDAKREGVWIKATQQSDSVFVGGEYKAIAPVTLPFYSITGLGTGFPSCHGLDRAVQGLHGAREWLLLKCACYFLSGRLARESVAVPF